MEQNQKLYLFQLIQALSASEKGYVKKYCTRNGTGAIYLKLFDAIEKQDVYDEEALKVRFKKEKFVKQLSVAKNYLTKAILRSLRAYYSESSKNIQVHELLLEIEILYNKRLIGLCQKLLKKVRKIVVESGLYKHYAEVSFWEFRVQLLTKVGEETDTNMNAIYAFAQEGNKAEALLAEYRHLAYHIYKYMLKEGYSREEEALEVALKYSEHPLLLLSNPPQNNARALARYYNIWTKIYEIQNDFEGSFEASRGFLQVVQAHPLIFSDFLMATVIPAHYNLLASCVLLNKEAIFFEHLDYLQEIPKTYRCKNESIINLIKYYSISLELNFYTQNAHFDRTVQILPKAEVLVQSEKLLAIGLEVLQVELTYTIGYAHFALGNFEIADHWIVETLAFQKNNIREDIMCMAQLMHLVNHAEMGNYEYLSYKVRSAYNYIKKMQKAHAFEQVTLQFLKKLINVRDSTSLKMLLMAFKTKFEEIEADPFERMIIKNFDIISVLESKIQQRPFALVARERREGA